MLLFAASPFRPNGACSTRTTDTCESRSRITIRSQVVYTGTGREQVSSAPRGQQEHAVHVTHAPAFPCLSQKGDQECREGIRNVEAETGVLAGGFDPRADHGCIRAAPALPGYYKQRHI